MEPTADGDPELDDWHGLCHFGAAALAGFRGAFDMSGEHSPVPALRILTIALGLALGENAPAADPPSVVDWHQWTPIDYPYDSISQVRDIIEYRGDLILGGRMYTAFLSDQDGSTQHEYGIAVFRDQLRMPLLGDRAFFDGSDDRVNALLQVGDRLIVGGRFLLARGAPVSHVLAFDPTQDPMVDDLGGGVPFAVSALCNWNGNLVCAPELRVREVGTELLWLWDGAGWSQIDMPTDVDYVTVRSLVEWQGKLCVGGMFLAGGESAHEGRSVAIWDGNDWSWPGGGLRSDAPASNGSLPDGQQGVSDLEPHAGELVAVGSFRNELSAIWGAARWNGNAWLAYPTREADLRKIIEVDGDVVFLGAGQRLLPDLRPSEAPCRWDGSQFVALAGTEASVFSPPVMSYAGTISNGALTLADVHGVSQYLGPHFGLLRYDGTGLYDEWGRGGVPGWITALLSVPSGIMLAGNFDFAGGRPMSSVARWTGSEFEPMSAGLAPWDDLEHEPYPQLASFRGVPILGGAFGLVDSPAQNVARWDGQRWQPMAEGLQTSDPETVLRTELLVRDMLEFEDRLLVGGAFDRSGAEEIHALASWDGANWQTWGEPFVVSIDATTLEPIRPVVHELERFDDRLWISGKGLSVDGVHAHRLAYEEGGAWTFIPVPEGMQVRRLVAAGDHLVVALTNLQSHATRNDIAIVRDGQLDIVTHEAPWDGRGQLGAAARIGSELWVLLNGSTYRYQGGQLDLIEGFGEIGFSAVVGRGSQVFVGGWAASYGNLGHDLAFQIGNLDRSVSAFALRLRADRGDAGIRLSCELPAGVLPERLNVERHEASQMWRSVAQLTPDSNSITLHDLPTTAGLYRYRVIAYFGADAVASNDVEIYFGSEPHSAVSYLQAVSPNPFNPTTHVDFALARPGRVRVDIYRVDGRRVLSRDLGELAAGPQSWQWDGRDDEGNTVASGSYVLRILAPDRNLSTRLVLLK